MGNYRISGAGEKINLPESFLWCPFSFFQWLPGSLEDVPPSTMTV